MEKTIWSIFCVTVFVIVTISLHMAYQMGVMQGCGASQVLWP